MSESKPTYNMTVGDLKDRLKDLPDDMAVIIPCNEDITDHDHIDGFKYIRTAGVLECSYEKPALCLNTAGELDICGQVERLSNDVSCTKVLF